MLLAVADSALGQAGSGDCLGPLLAVNCLDVPAPRPDAYPRLATQLAATAPHFGALTMYLTAPCAFWPVRAQRDAEPIRPADAPPLVVIGTTGDPTTPYAWSQALARQLGGDTVLVTRDAESRTAFGGTNVCTDLTVIRYLIELIPPPADTRCG
ncbi:MAG: alpha/beta hydrolase [Actinomycetota bacterium]|nr:alpha/beta hydrolase [Actinomycetota bacterium]